METREEIVNPPANCEIVSSRNVSAPRQLVFKAWTDPKHLEMWWGPKGFTNTFHDFNLHPGGAWRFTMHGPGGEEYRNESVFIKIIEPSKLVWDHISGPKFQGVATFEELPEDHTRVTFRMIFRSVGECEKVKVYAVDANEQNFDRLEKELTVITS